MSDRNKRCSDGLTESRHSRTMRCGINNTFAGYLLPLGEIKQGYKEGEKGTLWRYILESCLLMTWQLTESGMGQDFNHQIDVEVVKNLEGLLWCWHGKRREWQMWQTFDLFVHISVNMLGPLMSTMLPEVIYSQCRHSSFITPKNEMSCLVSSNTQPNAEIRTSRFSLCLWHNFQPLLI